MRTLFYATIDPHLDTLVVWQFNAKERKDGSYKAKGMLSFMGYVTILARHHLNDCGATAQEAVDKLKKRKLWAIKQVQSSHDQLVNEVNHINATEPRLIQFPIKPKAKVNVVI